MKGNPMQRNFGIGDSPMRIGGLVRKAAKKVISKLSSKAPKAKKEFDMADIPRKANPKRVKDIPNIKAVDIRTGKTVSSKDFDPMKTYRYEEIAKPKVPGTKTKKLPKNPARNIQGRHEKITGRTKYSYHDYNKDVKGRIRQ